MASVDPTLTALAVYSAYKLSSRFIKSKKAKRTEKEGDSMNEIKKIQTSNIYKTTFYNALCGVIGNVMYDIGKEMPSLNNPPFGGFLFSGPSLFSK
jgi:Na+/glutamate symporter|uniref:Uncharacterized protein n=2 Tax=root TaxID=1 RepID=A0A8S5PP30_9CAUD|nr:MAG TPA: hypothetical protein [Siphoviridae sp. ctXQ014]